MTIRERLTKRVHSAQDKVSDQKRYIERYSNSSWWTNSDRKKEAQKLEKYEAELAQAKAELEALPKLEDVPAIKAYLDDYAKKMIAWIERCHEEYPKKKQEWEDMSKAFAKEHPEYVSWGTDLTFRGSDIFRREHFIEYEELENLRMGDRFYENRIDIIARDVEIKYINLVEKVKEITGRITDASFIRVNEKGSLDGYIEGENGRARVNTFEAGGWNIQRFHYRTKVTKIGG